MVSKTIVACLLLSVAHVSSFQSINSVARVPTQLRFSDSNTDLFGGPTSTEEKAEAEVVAVSTETEGAETSTFQTQAGKMKDEAAKLRKEAADMEVSMREEARAKGIPEEMINKLIPLRSATPTKKAAAAEEAEEVKEVKVYTPSEVRSKLGYLNTGDAIRMTTELDRVSQKGFLQRWNAKDVSKVTFRTNTLQFKTKTNIDPIKLKLDDVGFNYQNVLIAALAFGTVFGLGSSFVGGELGFILGYASALVPVTLVGLGSIAPGLIGDILNGVQYQINAEAKEKYISMNAGKFLAGYVLGLPVAKFSTGGVSNQVEFFQIRPSGKSAVQDKQMFARNKFKQNDIARSSVVCIAGSVAECVYFGEGSGTNAGDVNTLYELINAVDPALPPESIQDHVRWSAMTAYEIIDEYKDEHKKLCEAFGNGLPLEECIAILEGKE